MKTFFESASFLLSFLFLQSHAWALCPLCRRTLEMSGNGGLIQGIQISIVLIAGIPLVIGAVIFYIFYSHRRKPLN